MIEKMNERVSVSMIYDSVKQYVSPRSIVWKNRLYPVKKIGFHHTFRKGRTLFHVFSVSTPTLFFRLVLDTDTLRWKVEEISDGLVS